MKKRLGGKPSDNRGNFVIQTCIKRVESHTQNFWKQEHGCLYQICLLQSLLSWSRLLITHHIINILPVVEGDELECSEHGPEEVVEVGVPVVRVLADPEACVVLRTVPAHKTTIINGFQNTYEPAQHTGFQKSPRHTIAGAL